MNGVKKGREREEKEKKNFSQHASVGKHFTIAYSNIAKSTGDGVFFWNNNNTTAPYR
jgi:hypothetical protein